MQPSRLFRIDDLLEEPAPACDDAPGRDAASLRVPTAAELSRQILRLAAMAIVEHQRIAQESDTGSANDASNISGKRAA